MGIPRKIIEGELDMGTKIIDSDINAASKIKNVTSNNNGDNEDFAKIKQRNKDLEAQMQEMNRALVAMQSQMLELGQTANNGDNVQNEKDEEVVIGCRAFSGCPLSNLDESIAFKLECGEEKYILVDDLKELFKDNMYKHNKVLFQKGVFYFTDESNYERFRIKKEKDLTPSNICRILLLQDINSVITEFNALTNSKTDATIMHTVLFMIAMLLDDEKRPLKDWDYDNRVVLEKYIGETFKFDTIKANVNWYKYLGKQPKISR